VNKWKPCQIFNSNPQVIRLRGRPKTNGGIVYKQILINAKLQIGKGGQKSRLSGRNPFRRGRSALDLMFVDPCIIVHFVKKYPTRCNNVSKFYYSV
jgi:hypothetical protein